MSLPNLCFKKDVNQRAFEPLERYQLDFDCDAAHEVDSRIGDVVAIQPQLVFPEEIHAPEAYKRFRDLEKKEAYRASIRTELENALEKQVGYQGAKQLLQTFLFLAENFKEEGAVVLAAITSHSKFQDMIENYQELLSESGSQSWLHSYVNLGNHPDFLMNKDFNQAFMHPLLVLLVSYQIGAPVRVVDGRGKDAMPISVKAQDNMLHIDNTPFNDEMKIITTWEKGKVSGPKGQNFVFLPGTQKGARQCMMGRAGPWSSENASIFVQPETVDQMLDFQEQVYGRKAIVELTHDTKPLTTLFQAGALVHHRHRTAKGFSRSCIIIAFHSSEDNPGQLVAPQYLQRKGKTAEKTDRLYQFLLGDEGSKPHAHHEFLKAVIEDHLADICSVLSDLSEQTGEVELVSTLARELSTADIQKWKGDCTDSPTVEVLKREKALVDLDAIYTKEQFIQKVVDMMLYDKHGPLDLILYPDSHEEIRKWARNQIREMKVAKLKERLQVIWGKELRSPTSQDLLPREELHTIALELSSKSKPIEGQEALLAEHEKITTKDAYRSVAQLLEDLGESILRCENMQAYVSTSLFLFWGASTLMEFRDKVDPGIKESASILLHNYLATAVLEAKATVTEEAAVHLDVEDRTDHLMEDAFIYEEQN